MKENSIAIQAEGVSKLYRLGVKEDTQDSLGGMLMNFIKSPFKNYRKYRSIYDFGDVGKNGDLDLGEGQADVFWALKDVSFEVKRGEVLGIIGNNGAGKSTLLKILSRITPPTHGRVQIYGRVISLLEVGTGFHPELTGRENVYLNATILGMRKKEVERKFDEIVSFSGVEKFLDTPVKRYSSGMRVRLAFAVAAHLEPEILIVDEVLAVGDAEFQKKCLNKMQDVGRQGQTILFVSHSMPAITRMCERVILLRQGKIVMDGSAHEVVSAYLTNERKNTAQREWSNPAEAPGGEVARLCAVRLRTEDGDIVDTVDIRRPIGVEMEYEVLKPDYAFMPTFSLWNGEGVNLCVAIDQDQTWRKRPRPVGRYVSTGWVPGNLLAEGLFTVNVTLWTMEPFRNMEYHERDVVAFQVIDNLEGDSARGDWQGDLPGMVRPILKWTTKTVIDR